MRLTIDTEVLRKHHLSLGQFIILLTSYYSLDCQKLSDELIKRGFAEKDLFRGFPPILSDNTKNVVARVLMESDARVKNGPMNFDQMARILQDIYPDGIKPGKTYEWRGKTEDIALKLMTLVVSYNFHFTAEEALRATEEYVSSFNPPYTYMHTLRNFLLYRNEEGDIESLFMTIIENNRRENGKNNN